MYKRQKKLHHPWTGPFKVVSRLSDVTYRIQNVQSRRNRLVVHFNRLKACPPHMRLNQEKAPLQHHQHSLPPEPVGSNLEIIDDPDYRSELRYPRRQRRPPDYLHSFISH